MKVLFSKFLSALFLLLVACGESEPQQRQETTGDFRGGAIGGGDGSCLSARNEAEAKTIGVIKDIIEEGPDLSCASQKSRTSLDLSRRSLTNITSLRHFPKLKSLNLSRNDIKDLRALESKQDLEELYLDHNLIEDLRPLKNLVNLRILKLKGNPIKNSSTYCPKDDDVVEILREFCQRLADGEP